MVRIASIAFSGFKTARRILKNQIEHQPALVKKIVATAERL
jgi:hypothetical protein